MRKIIQTAVTIAVLTVLCTNVNAQPAMSWSFKSEKVAADSYMLHIICNLPAGWSVYGINDGIDGISAPSFTFQYENVQIASEPKFSSSPTIIKKDPVFENKTTAVYSGAFDFLVQIKIKETVPATLK